MNEEQEDEWKAKSRKVKYTMTTMTMWCEEDDDEDNENGEDEDNSTYTSRAHWPEENTQHTLPMLPFAIIITDVARSASWESTQFLRAVANGCERF